MTIQAIPATLLADFYKITHRMFYPEGTTEVYSTWTPRSAEYFRVKTKEKEYAVGSGFQLFNKKYLVDFFNDNFFNRTEEEVVAAGLGGDRCAYQVVGRRPARFRREFDDDRCGPGRSCQRQGEQQCGEH